ncbi:MAG TPA: HlyD family efflux transporter periplasmic adaptor subunit [Candidatus Sumerlaeota bacterium]|nr:HlyD family efflux transporter periplasmic adaptor subunit [Candidatus Sumerlaeota bacterium]
MSAPSRSNPGSISTPFSIRIKFFARRHLPVLVFLLALVVIYFLSRGAFRGGIVAVGIVEAVNADVSPTIDGRVEHINVQLLQRVQKGDPVAEIVSEDPVRESEMQIALSKLEELRLSLEMERAKLRYDYEVEKRAEQRDMMTEKRRFDVDVESAELDYIDRTVQQAADRVALARLDVLVGYQKRLLDKKVGVPQEYDDKLMERDTLAKKVEENKRAVQYSERRREEARARRDTITSSTLTAIPIDDILAPLTKSIDAQVATIEELRKGVRQVLRSPITGSISDIPVVEGMNVTKGTPVLTVNAEGSHRILAYVDETLCRDIEVGTKVHMISRRYPGKILVSQVEQVGTRVERYPLRLLPKQDFSRYGLSVIVPMPTEGPKGGPTPADLYPGDVLDLWFKPEK